MKLGEAVRSLRSSKGYSQQEFARLLDISPSYLSLIEKGHREPTIPLLRAMAAKLGAPATVLFAAALGSALPARGHEQERRVIKHLVEATRLNIAADRLAEPDGDR